MATEQQWQNEVAYRVGAAMPGAPAMDAESTQLMVALKGRIPVLWDMYASKTSWPLRFLYSLREAIDLILGALRNKVDGNLGGALTLRNEAKFGHLLRMREDTQKEIERLELRQRAGMAPCVGQILQQSPVMVGSVVTDFATVDGVTVARTVLNAEGRQDPSAAGWRGSPLARQGDTHDRLPGIPGREI